MQRRSNRSCCSPSARSRTRGDDEKRMLSELEAIHKELKSPQRSSDTIRIRESKPDQDT
jgi:hypothetical protein